MALMLLPAKQGQMGAYFSPGFHPFQRQTTTLPILQREIRGELLRYIGPTTKRFKKNLETISPTTKNLNTPVPNINTPPTRNLIILLLAASMIIGNARRIWNAPAATNPHHTSYVYTNLKAILEAARNIHKIGSVNSKHRKKVAGKLGLYAYYDPMISLHRISQQCRRTTIYIIRDKGYPLDNALIPTSSTTTIPFPFKRLQSLHICWNAVNWGGITSLEKILQQIDFLRHLVIEGRWRFRVKEDILCCIAVNAPHLKTLSLLRLQWFPSSLGSPIVSRIVSSWKKAFVEKGRVPGLKLERFCITESATKGSGVDLMKNVVLPSPCLDFEHLRYLAISANGLLEALGDARFEIFSKQITHLAIVKLDTHMLGFRLNADIFPNLSHIQLDVYKECNLQQFLQNIQINTTPTTSFPPLTHMHINLKKGFMIRENTEKTMFDQSDVLHASNVDSALQRFIVNLAASVHISMHFAQLGEGSEIQRSCIRQVFPRSVLVRQLEWMEPKSLEWWLG
ncbi:hypothetical protein FB446DRAFT_700211 [Lentinula raphanica]|nr:hypothetical protein FB446DRAFT_700211 [Lentinula raphanica]